jgi:hypothetical protein
MPPSNTMPMAARTNQPADARDRDVLGGLWREFNILRGAFNIDFSPFWFYLSTLIGRFFGFLLRAHAG